MDTSTQDQKLVPFKPRIKDRTWSSVLQHAQALLIADQLQDATTYVDEQIALAVRSPSIDSIRAACSLSILIDLVEHGWSARTHEDSFCIVRPTSAEKGSSRSDVQGLTRLSLHAARAHQFREKSVAAFLRSMTEPSKTKRSVYDLLRDGPELARQLRATKSCEDPHLRRANLAQLIQPYIQFVQEGDVDDHTGHKLSEIWRYFRYTWLTPYRSTPGRSMMILIRDRAVEPNPIIGIASIASAIVRQGNRDRFIGWDADEAADELRRSGTTADSAWLKTRLDCLIEAIYRDDFVNLGLVSQSEIDKPNTTVVRALLAHSERIQPAQAEEIVRGQAWFRTSDLEREAMSPLFTKKRASTLAALLSIKEVLGPHLGRRKGEEFRLALDLPDVRDAAKRLLRSIKAETVGTAIMDINVCGAVAPYGDLLGGKLVALLMTSPEVRDEYRRRYSEAESIIASRMAGCSVKRPAELVVLTTSGIYAGRSSQYNRLAMDWPVRGQHSTRKIRFQDCGQTESYTTLHFSKRSVDLLQKGFELENRYRHVNSKFGEGVSPRLRKIRQQLDALGLESDELLRGGTSRTMYVIKLADNALDVLLGRSSKPDFIAQDSARATGTSHIAMYWINRWLNSRIEYEPALQRVAQHSKAFVRFHGGAVRVPDDCTDQLSFEEIETFLPSDEEEERGED
jgi:hypothetical protein